MRCLLIKPMEVPRVMEVEHSLEALQNAVGGSIQAICPWEDYAAIICNDEGKLLGLKPNRALYGEDGVAYDIIAGDFLIVGIDEEDAEFKDLPDELIGKFKSMFSELEMFPNLEWNI